MIRHKWILIVLLVVLIGSITSGCWIHDKSNKKHVDLLMSFDIVRSPTQEKTVSRGKAIIQLAKVLGVSDSWAERGVYGTNPALVEAYSDYAGFSGDYSDLELGYMGLCSHVICGVDKEKYGYPIELRPKDFLTKQEALEYMLFCVEEQNPDKNKKVLYRARDNNIIEVFDFMSFTELNSYISEKQYNKLLYKLLNHKRYLYLTKERALYVEHDLDIYNDSAITYKKFLEQR